MVDVVERRNLCVSVGPTTSVATGSVVDWEVHVRNASRVTMEQSVPRNAQAVVAMPATAMVPAQTASLEKAPVLAIKTGTTVSGLEPPATAALRASMERTAPISVNAALMAHAMTAREVKVFAPVNWATAVGRVPSATLQ